MSLYDFYFRVSRIQEVRKEKRIRLRSGEEYGGKCLFKSKKGRDGNE